MNELLDILYLQIFQLNSLHHPPPSGEVGEGGHERMGSVYFVITIGSNQQQMGIGFIGEQNLQQLQRSQICPLPIVNKNYQGMLGCADSLDKVLKG